MPILIFCGDKPPVRLVDAYEKFLEDFHPTYVARPKKPTEKEPTKDEPKEPFRFTTSPIM